jgi:hypothetical protein
MKASFSFLRTAFPRQGNEKKEEPVPATAIVMRQFQEQALSSDPAQARAC